MRQYQLTEQEEKKQFNATQKIKTIQDKKTILKKSMEKVSR